MEARHPIAVEPRQAERVRVCELVAKNHARGLRVAAGRLTRDDDDAADLVQDAFERAIRGASPIDETELRRWLIAVVRNLFVTKHRQERARERAFDTLRTLQGESGAEDEPSDWSNVTTAELTSALARLDSIFREVFELHLRSTPLAQIALELDISPATVGTRLFRARRKLKALLTAPQHAGAEEAPTRQ